MQIEYKTTESIETTREVVHVREIEDIENVYFCGEDSTIQHFKYWGQSLQGDKLRIIEIECFKESGHLYVNIEFDKKEEAKANIKYFLELNQRFLIKEIAKEEFFEALNKVKKEI